MPRALLGIVAALAALTLAGGCGSAVSEEELARRVEASHPTWESYSEDIKAQLGAGPAAEWEGTLQDIRVETGQIRVTFTLRGPWAQRSVAAPILLNEPLTGVHQNTAAERNDNRVIYGFPLPKAKSSLTVPWVEFKFPGGQRRVALSEQGTCPTSVSCTQTISSFGVHTPIPKKALQN